MKNLIDAITVPSVKELQGERLWIESEVKRIGEKKLKKLVSAADAVRKHVYAPYSNYLVGAAVLTKSGAVYAGCNAEVASYTQSSHAEQTTVTKAITEGEATRSGRRFIEAIAIVHEGNSGPCGQCRQILLEHADNALVLWAGPAGNIRKITSLTLLLPDAFTPTHVGMA